jgi:hypothetical protein
MMIWKYLLASDFARMLSFNDSGRRANIQDFESGRRELAPRLPPALKFKAAPPLITDINISLVDRCCCSIRNYFPSILFFHEKVI